MNKLEKQITELSGENQEIRLQAEQDIKLKDIELQRLKESMGKIQDCLKRLEAEKEQLVVELEHSTRIKHIVSDATTEETSLQTEEVLPMPDEAVTQAELQESV